MGGRRTRGCRSKDRDDGECVCVCVFEHRMSIYICPFGKMHLCVCAACERSDRRMTHRQETTGS